MAAGRHEGVRGAFAIAMVTAIACGQGDDAVRSLDDGDGGGAAATGGSVDDDAAGTEGRGSEEGSAGLPDVDPFEVFWPTCAVEPVVRRGLELLGTTGGVHVGPAPELGLSRFTLEAWVQWQGYGTAAVSGADGVTAEPIVAKGRGEDDGSNVDCNYFLGVDAAGKLVADFEDVEAGDNHPIASEGALVAGRWTHVAATYDGAMWRLFVDGQLEASAAVVATPRFDSIQHFGIGTAFDSLGAAQGGFDGLIEDVRVWDRALAQAEIQSGIFGIPIDPLGLVAHWPLDEAIGKTAHDVVGGRHGLVAGARWEPGGPPSLASTAPAEPALVAPLQPVLGGNVTLVADVFDLDGDEMRVEFFARPRPELEPFTIVVLPDTQYYVAEMNGGNAQMFFDQTQWVAENAEALDIRAVLHVGDLVEHQETYPDEWVTAEMAMQTLEAALPGWPEGIPYGIAIGNHDQAGGAMPGMTMLYNQHFGADRFEGRSYYGGHYGPPGQVEEKNDNSFITFSAGALDFVAIFFEYDQPGEPEGNTGPDAEVLAWARGVLRDHPDHLGILVAHSCLQNSEESTTVGTPHSGQGLARWQALRGEPNVRLALCGHVRTEGRRTDVAASVMHSLLADYQFDGAGGSGKLRILTFHPSQNALEVRTYSPYLDQEYEGDDAHFWLDVDLDFGAGVFQSVGVVEHVEGGEASLVWANVPPGQYEWYATATDCVHTSTSAHGSFVAG